MSEKTRGFTLIELIIVVSIIGILVALITPNVIQKIQDGKQIGTMSDINTIAEACLEYVAENDVAPAAEIQNGPLAPNNAFIKAITEKHLTTCPVQDHWGNPLVVYSGKSVANFAGFSEDMVEEGDFLIISYGRYGQPEGFTFDPDNREAGMFKVSTMDDFKKDLVSWNGTWIRAPRTSGSKD
jgi:prepilin-type N-terminal cleavage/methylation domain-containing protein